MLLLSLFVLFLGGVSGAETQETMTVMEGDSVTLQTNLTEVLNDDTILWLYGPKDSVISQITRKHDLTSFFVTDDERFRGRLQVDQKTGSLTIRNTRIKHSGQYKLSISRQKSTTEIFNVIVSGMVGEMDGVKSVSVSVMEGESVTLQNDVSGVQRDDLIVWRFGDKGTLLAKIDAETNENSFNNADVRFRDRLMLDHQTGSLTIKNTRTEHSGLYEVQIRGSETSQRFLLSVTAVPGSGLSPGGIAGIIVAALLLALVVTSVVIYYRRKISELEKKAETTEVKVPDGKFVTLKTETNLQEDDTVKWWYHDNNNLIAEINQNDKKVYDGFEERFRSKLKLDVKTGNLSINNTMAIHTGLYILEIRSKTRIIHKKFILTVTMETVEVKEGDPVPLKTDTEIQPDDVILWTFGPENCLVVKADPGMTVGGRFRDRVKLDGKTGSLTIRNSSNTDSGHYKIQIINNRQTTFRRFNVSVTETTAEKVSVSDGDAVTLKTETNLQEDDTVKWWYHDNRDLIAEIKKNDKGIYGGFDERFRSKLKLDEKTGNLSINNTMTIHTGLYILEISNKTRIIHKRFILTVTMETVEVKEGDPVPLKTDTEIQPDDVILWTFGPENCLVVKADPGMTVGGRFRDRVKLDGKTGSLTIRNISNTDSGHYKLQIINNRQTTFRRFNVSVTEEQLNDSMTVRMSLLNKVEENVLV